MFQRNLVRMPHVSPSWEEPGAAEAQDFQNLNFSDLLKLSASFMLPPVNHLESKQRNWSFIRTMPGIRDAPGDWEAVNTNTNMHKEATASTEITCLSPKAVKAVDLCSLHLFFIFFWKIEQVGDDLKQNDVSDHELKCVIQELLTPSHELLHRRKRTVSAWHPEIKDIFFLRLITEPAALYKQKNPTKCLDMTACDETCQGQFPLTVSVLLEMTWCVQWMHLLEEVRLRGSIW